ncbi:dehydrogenase/reductase SDR family member 1 [Fasciola hepatica]|uniref:Dehydrogenase/reductase SDR family member 1 n=1 Tax=Fasciola hepatica TaxID=6192 RepID=A0A4E0RDC8_FASHE|nr:dehydrogenase/reductase SDR family member 1 [Fasciola hepatica]
MGYLNDYVCLVTGASRGIGRGIALGLGEQGATVYITGRTMHADDSGDVGGSLESTAADINARGGAYFEIDECSPGEAWDTVNNAGLRNSYICATLATRMMMDYRKQMASENSRPGTHSRVGLIINISSVGAHTYLFSAVYGIGKAATDRMVADMSVELKRHAIPISMISLWPGLVRTELMVKYAKDLFHLAASESPELSGRVVAALAAEPDKEKLARSGEVTFVSDVASQYGIREVDGSAPAHMRSLQTLLLLGGYRVAPYVPSFIRLPKSWFLYALSWFKM